MVHEGHVHMSHVTVSVHESDGVSMQSMQKTKVRDIYGDIATDRARAVGRVSAFCVAVITAATRTYNVSMLIRDSDDTYSTLKNFR